MKDMLSQGIDWISSDILSTMVAKAVSFADGLVSHTSDTVVVPFKSNPGSPHVVNLFSNGRVEFSNCPGFASFSICAHALGACMSKDRLSNFLCWLVSTKQNSGGVNLSAAVTCGMPRGRGRKGERAPRKRNTTKKQITKVVHGTNSSLNNNFRSPKVFSCSGVVNTQSHTQFSGRNQFSDTNHPLPNVPNQPCFIP